MIGLNARRIQQLGTNASLDDLFFVLYTFTQEEYDKIMNASSIFMYSEGHLRFNNIIIYNPLVDSENMTGEISLKPWSKPGRFRFSNDRRWVLFHKEPGTMLLMYNTIYAPDFVKHTEVEPVISKHAFIQYCNLVDYEDPYCLCIEAPALGYNADHCIRNMGYNPDELTSYQYNQIAAACSCFTEGCSDLWNNDKFASYFDRSCNIQICEQDINITDTSAAGNISITSCFESPGGDEDTTGTINGSGDGTTTSTTTTTQGGTTQGGTTQGGVDEPTTTTTQDTNGSSETATTTQELTTDDDKILGLDKTMFFIVVGVAIFLLIVILLSV